MPKSRKKASQIKEFGKYQGFWTKSRKTDNYQGFWQNQMKRAQIMIAIRRLSAIIQVGHITEQVGQQNYISKCESTKIFGN